MSHQAFEENCKGCEPAIIDIKTGKVMPPEHPAMQAVMRIWATLPKADKEAWHEFTCQNSRSPQVLAVIARITARFQEETVSKGRL